MRGGYGRDFQGTKGRRKKVAKKLERRSPLKGTMLWLFGDIIKTWA